MSAFRQYIFGSAAAAVIACAAVAPAAAHDHERFHAWGLGRCLVGAVVGLVTLPIAIASAVVEASEPEAFYSAEYDGLRAYAPQGYVAPQSFYAPAPYYARPPVYYAAAPGYYAPRAHQAPRSYYAPRVYHAPRTYYAPRADSYPYR